MEKRLVEPELLDHLPPHDPDALRSRRDLRRINALMGNESWICRTIRRFPEQAARGVVEIGAGDGFLTSKLAMIFPDTPITAYDFAPRPAHLPDHVEWRQGDLFQQKPASEGGIAVANLFLHHFEGQPLRDVGHWCRDFQVLIFNEPDRKTVPHLLGGLMHPFINRITRHDMHVSIRAGFAAGELAALMELESKRWQVEESSSWRGSRRAVAWRV